MISADNIVYYAPQILIVGVGGITLLAVVQTAKLLGENRKLRSKRPRKTRIIRHRHYKIGEGLR